METAGKCWGSAVPVSPAETYALATCLVCPNDVSIFFCFPCVFLCLPFWLTDANTPKKCRALFGLDQLSLWCKPCRYTPKGTFGKDVDHNDDYEKMKIDFFFSPLLLFVFFLLVSSVSYMFDKLVDFGNLSLSLTEMCFNRAAELLGQKVELCGASCLSVIIILYHL